MITLDKIYYIGFSAFEAAILDSLPHKMPFGFGKIYVE